MKSLVFSQICLLLWTVPVLAQHEDGLVITPEKTADQVIQSLKGINEPLKCTIAPAMEYVCDNMAKLSCTDGTYSDGTGTTLSEAAYRKKVSPKSTKMEKLYADAIGKLLNHSSSKYDLVRRLAIEATGQQATPECVSKTKSDQKKCHQRVAEILGTKHAAQEFPMFTNPGVSKSALDFVAYMDLNSNQLYTEALNQVHPKAFALLDEAKQNDRIREKTFPRVKKLILAKIDSVVLDETQRKILKRKIESIVYMGNDCTGSFGSSRNGHLSVSGLMTENAFYSLQSNTFRFCNGFLLKSDSEFMIASVIAHELTHSIDPCNITKPATADGFKYKYEVGAPIGDVEKQNPFGTVLGCLRTKSSVKAERGFGSPEKVNPEDLFNGVFCANDQIGESFSDWMGAEITGEYIEKYHSRLSASETLNGYSNLMRPFCSMAVSPGTNPYSIGTENFDEHPPMRNRLERIYMANPTIRKQLGCGESKTGVKYCAAEKKQEAKK